MLAQMKLLFVVLLFLIDRSYSFNCTNKRQKFCMGTNLIQAFYTDDLCQEGALWITKHSTSFYNDGCGSLNPYPDLSFIQVVSQLKGAQDVDSHLSYFQKGYHTWVVDDGLGSCYEFDEFGIKFEFTAKPFAARLTTDRTAPYDCNGAGGLYDSTIEVDLIDVTKFVRPTNQRSELSNCMGFSLHFCMAVSGSAAVLHFSEEQCSGQLLFVSRYYSNGLNCSTWVWPPDSLPTVCEDELNQIIVEKTDDASAEYWEGVRNEVEFPWTHMALTFPVSGGSFPLCLRSQWGVRIHSFLLTEQLRVHPNLIETLVQTFESDDCSGTPMGEHELTLKDRTAAIHGYLGTVHPFESCPLGGSYRLFCNDHSEWKMKFDNLCQPSYATVENVLGALGDCRRHTAAQWYTERSITCHEIVEALLDFGEWFVSDGDTYGFYHENSTRMCMPANHELYYTLRFTSATQATYNDFQDSDCTDVRSSREVEIANLSSLVNEFCPIYDGCPDRTGSPTISLSPSLSPTLSPTNVPSKAPTNSPTNVPTNAPTKSPGGATDGASIPTQSPANGTPNANDISNILDLSNPLAVPILVCVTVALLCAIGGCLWYKRTHGTRVLRDDRYDEFEQDDFKDLTNMS